MHKYRTHKCNELRIENVNDQVKLSGWVHRKRDHGQLIFIDLRDHYGLTQVVVDSSNENFSIFESLPLESVITVLGKVVERSDETINDNLPTGRIEINLSELEIISQSKALPLQVNSDEDYGEETRLKFRYLDLRRNPIKNNLIFRNNLSFEIGFEIQSKSKLFSALYFNRTEHPTLIFDFNLKQFCQYSNSDKKIIYRGFELLYNFNSVDSNNLETTFEISRDCKCMFTS